MDKYDVVIIGGGAGGAFAAYEFSKLNSKLKILVIEKGVPLGKRSCPILEGKVYQVQAMSNYERIWRSRNSFGWKI